MPRARSSRRSRHRLLRSWRVPWKYGTAKEQWRQNIVAVLRRWGLSSVSLRALQRVAAVVFVVDMLVELVIPNAYSMVLLPVNR